MCMKHSKPQKEWLFDEPKNVATFTMRQIIRGGHPILLVSHDSHDGSWQFLTGGTFSTEDGMLVALSEIVKHDPTVSELADLPLGWIAQRDDVGSSWRRSKDDHAG